MNRISMAALVGVAGLAFIVGQNVRPSTSTAATVGATTQPEGGDDMAAAMEAMMAAGAVGEHHEYLAAMLGTWEGVFKMRMAPDAPMMEFPSVAKREWVLDGRFLREVVTSSMDGQPFEGLGYTGYNNTDQRYEAIWMDNMSTCIYSSHGDYDAKTHILRVYGTRRDPASGRVVTGWSELDMSNPNRHVMKGWETAADGSTFLSSEGVFERRR